MDRRHLHMDEEQYDNQLRKAVRLLWKLLFYTYEGRPLGKVLKLAPAQKGYTKFLDAAAEVCLDYCFSRFVDDERTWNPDSAFTTHIAVLMARIAKPGSVYAGGSGEVAIEIGECLMRFDGWHPKSAQHHAEFRKCVLSVAVTKSSLEMELVEKYDGFINDHFSFTGDLAEEAFHEVDDFRERQGNFLYAFES